MRCVFHAIGIQQQVVLGHSLAAVPTPCHGMNGMSLVPWYCICACVQVLSWASTVAVTPSQLVCSSLASTSHLKRLMMSSDGSRYTSGRYQPASCLLSPTLDYGFPSLSPILRLPALFWSGSQAPPYTLCCFCMCLTTSSNRLMLQKPSDILLCAAPCSGPC